MLNCWIDLYETKLSNLILKRLYQCIINISPQVNKLALVGNISILNKIRISRTMKKEQNFKTQIKYFEDPEIGKTWIVIGK